MGQKAAGDGAVQLDNEQDVPVSRRYRKALRERVQA
jgi:DNA-binding LytR/AlgR family response regulator